MRAPPASGRPPSPTRPRRTTRPGRRADLVREPDADRGSRPLRRRPRPARTRRRASASRSRTRCAGRHRRAALRRRCRRRGRRRRSCGTSPRGEPATARRTASAASRPARPVIASMLSMPTTTSPVSSDCRASASSNPARRHRRQWIAWDSSRSGGSAAFCSARACCLTAPARRQRSRARRRRSGSHHASRDARSLRRRTTPSASATSPGIAAPVASTAATRIDWTPLGWFAARMISGSDADGHVDDRRRPATVAQARWLPAATDTEIDARTALLPALAMTRRSSWSGRTAITSISSASGHIAGDVNSVATWSSRERPLTACSSNACIPPLMPKTSASPDQFYRKS